MSSRLKDVAARAGVSVRTVSNVVSGAAPVAVETRRRVQEAIDELGYHPNLAARSLRAGRTGIIGLAIPELHSPYFSELAGLLVDEARRRSWTVLIDQTHGDAEAERRLLTPGGGRVVDGLIISPWALDPAELAAAQPSAPLVLLGERHPNGAADRVAVDNVTAADEATSHLIGLGRRRIAAIGTQPHLRNGTAKLRTEGYLRALDRAGLLHDQDFQRSVRALHRADGARAMDELLDGPASPDAVFAFSDELALGALHTAHQRGLRVPEDIAIVGFDDIEDGRYSNPPLTTVSPDKQQIAERSLQCLADRIYSPANTTPPQEITVPHRLVARSTT
ncbi:LacI family DNA-binding transcriptional regulator [Streptomyces globisporus]|uniref:LacI family DNA-binding transcriptional regulator n=1 Tax=Streptomyces globisporus TaxID=1908 RepID=UPI0005C7FCFC|nr:LacI family DNA-binding transcriptional regulator [Streptomyces globisporus]AWL84626.1 LacI family transcriptional regulator [Streptomyces globisporus]PPA38410.1 LacI family transcriptional regulator [Streptomyces griseus]